MKNEMGQSVNKEDVGDSDLALFARGEVPPAPKAVEVAEGDRERAVVMRLGNLVRRAGNGPCFTWRGRSYDCDSARTHLHLPEGGGPSGNVVRRDRPRLALPAGGRPPGVSHEGSNVAISPPASVQQQRDSHWSQVWGNVKH